MNGGIRKTVERNGSKSSPNETFHDSAKQSASRLTSDNARKVKHEVKAVRRRNKYNLIDNSAAAYKTYSAMLIVPCGWQKNGK